MGPFSIPVCLLKLLKNFLSTPLEIIYNLSFSSGCVPDHFKVANVIPVHKKDSVTYMNNYRPISLLPVFNRILEKLMYKRLSAFIRKHNILYDRQFGFRGKHCTAHATLLISDRIQKQWKMVIIHLEYFWTFQKHLILSIIIFLSQN